MTAVDTCAACGKPTRTAGAGGIYLAPDGRHWIYIVCMRCAKRALIGGRRGREELADAVELRLCPAGGHA